MRADASGAAVAARLVRIARGLLRRPDAATVGIWPRAAAYLLRQALEEALDHLWRRRAPALEEVSARAQLLCLPAYLPDDRLARTAAFAWSGLSAACHHHTYRLAPTASELIAYADAVDEVAAEIARVAG